jgi:nicotinamide riboside kinase
MASVDARSTTGLTVVIVGPESSGKTTLARALAAHFDAPWVAEVAREHLSYGAASGAGYDAAKLDQIARAQLDAEQHARATHQHLVILDTDLLVIDIWWRERFGKPPDWLVESLASTAPEPRRRYLLCPPDLPWEADPLRENPDDRERLYDLYRRRLTELGASYQVISGAGAGRSAAAISAIDGWLDIS